MLRELLDEKLFEYEDELMLANPRIMAEIREVRAEYEAGDYITLQELMAELNEARLRKMPQTPQMCRRKRRNLTMSRYKLA